MKKYIGLTLLITFVLLVCGLGILVTQYDSQPYVVMVRALDEEGQLKWRGSGSFIRPDLILTAGHIVKDTKEFEIILPNGKIRPAFFEYREDANLADVGFIRIRGDYPTTNFGKSARLGQDVWISGYAFAEMPLTLTKGVVSCLNRDNDFFGKLNLLQVDSASWPGHSGSPVLNKHNQIVGMLIGGLVKSDNWSICVPVNVIRLSLTKYDATKTLESEGK